VHARGLGQRPHVVATQLRVDVEPSCVGFTDTSPAPGIAYAVERGR